jgi:hypothetical protein
MLEQLPRLRGIKLGIHAYMGTGMGSGYTGVFPSVHLPAMLGVQALTELELAGEACLPPDWRQLSSLQRLRLLCRPCGYGGYLQLLTWGEAPLTALTALTCLELDRRVLPGGERKEKEKGAYTCTCFLPPAKDAQGRVA